MSNTYKYLICDESGFTVGTGDTVDEAAKEVFDDGTQIGEELFLYERIKAVTLTVSISDVPAKKAKAKVSIADVPDKKAAKGPRKGRARVC